MSRAGARVFCLAILLAMLASVVYAPPTPKSVRGTVFYNDNVTQAPSGLTVFINNTNLSQVVYTETYGPLVQPGRYIATVNATLGDTILVRSWNATHYGENTGIMGGTSITIDITLNKTRSSEANVTIRYPPNSSGYDAGYQFNVTATVQIIGNSGVSCFAGLYFSNAGVLSLKAGENSVVSLGNVNLWNSVLIKWNLTANRTGNTDIIVNASCSSDALKLDRKDRATTYNISVRDNSAPNISIFSPANNSRINNPMITRFNVTDGSQVLNCTLIVNNAIVEVMQNPSRGLILNFTSNLTARFNDWSINCTDYSNNTGTTGIYNLTINSRPSITGMTIENPVDLLAGINRSVTCNGTLLDLDGSSDLARVNATLYSQIYSSTEKPNNRSIHYSNSTCRIKDPAGNAADFVCGFDISYYALNGTWACNATVTDTINASNSSQIPSDMNQLLAIGINPVVLDYGNLQVKQESIDYSVNITNYGNMLLDLEIFGYSSFDDDGLAMNCSRGNITVNWERFDLAYGTNFASMITLGIISAPNSVNFNLPPSTESATSYKGIYWKIRVPEQTGGRCSGKVVFTAVQQ
jgi:hypothetical protein